MAFLSPAVRLVNGDERAAARLTSVIVATAHGHAMLMLMAPSALAITPTRPPPNRRRPQRSP
jgi:hypothetical protein